jgi:hypothetical protein
MDILKFRQVQNDLVACSLLRNMDRYQQLAILFPQENSLLKRMVDAAAANEDYEICQLITDLMENRKKIRSLFKNPALLN